MGNTILFFVDDPEMCDGFVQAIGGLNHVDCVSDDDLEVIFPKENSGAKKIEPEKVAGVVIFTSPDYGVEEIEADSIFKSTLSLVDDEIPKIVLPWEFAWNLPEKFLFLKNTTFLKEWPSPEDLAKKIYEKIS